MMSRKGFTLIELLVVIAIIALLMAVILPSLQAVKELASGVVCTNNQKSLCTAWVLYIDDNDNKLVGGSTYNSGSRPTPYRWVEPPLLQPIYGSTRANQSQLSQEVRINGIRAGKLYPYLENEKVYHCPGDRTFRNAEPLAVYRSYAVTGLMNGEDFITRTGGQFGPITQFRSVNLNGDTKELKVALNTADVKSPGTKLVFMEEDVVTWHNQYYNLGGWVLLGSGGLSWWDAPAGYHNEGSTFSYADGHADRRKWRDDDTISLVNEGILDPDPTNNEDLKWLVRGYIPMP